MDSSLTVQTEELRRKEEVLWRLTTLSLWLSLMLSNPLVPKEMKDQVLGMAKSYREFVKKLYGETILEEESIKN